MADCATGAGYHARLYDSEGVSRAVAAEELGGLRVGDQQMLWIDLEGADATLPDGIWQACGLPAAARAFVEGGTSPEVGQQGEYFWVRCVAVGDTGGGHTMSGCVLHCVAGPNRVVSIHPQAIPFIEALREQRNGEVPIGGLSSESFVATLLDRQLGTYFEAVSDYERAIERLEVRILASRAHDCLPELQRLRRWASRMRRMLAPHRNVFGVMSRPDFRPTEGRSADRHFVALDTRFERAMDMVENARELVLGSFELFSSQTALTTNDTMRVLTFVTVITGLLATLVGALGMNFDASFFETQNTGFWWAVGGLALVTAVALVLGRWRRWY
ncbi:MAG: hypothetical protein J7507_08255 [Pseudoxanthomonas sp.]|nr:hypothetical protein [Pseudoxanthomonas sp.]